MKPKVMRVRAGNRDQLLREIERKLLTERYAITDRLYRVTIEPLTSNKEMSNDNERAQLRCLG